jgi:hypothetical protein
LLHTSLGYASRKKSSIKRVREYALCSLLDSTDISINVEHDTNEVCDMILSAILGYVVGRLVRHRYVGPILVLLLGVLIGLASGLLRIPLLYPLMVVQGTGVVIPEFRELVICVVLPEVQLYSELVPMWFPYSMTLGAIMAGLSVVGAFVGWWPVRHSRRLTTPWEQDSQK